MRKHTNFFGPSASMLSSSEYMWWL